MQSAQPLSLIRPPLQGEQPDQRGNVDYAPSNKGETVWRQAVIYHPVNIAART